MTNKVWSVEFHPQQKKYIIVHEMSTIANVLTRIMNPACFASQDAAADYADMLNRSSSKGRE